jgi:transposase-like protein
MEPKHAREIEARLWSARLREHAESGVNIRSWCALEGVTEATFHYWRKRLSEASPATQLIALPLAERDGEPMLELQTPHGYMIRLGSQAQVAWLGAVLAALR